MYKLDKHRMYHFTLQASAWMDGYVDVITSCGAGCVCAGFPIPQFLSISC